MKTMVLLIKKPTEFKSKAAKVAIESEGYKQVLLILLLPWRWSHGGSCWNQCGRYECRRPEGDLEWSLWSCKIYIIFVVLK